MVETIASCGGPWAARRPEPELPRPAGVLRRALALLVDLVIVTVVLRIGTLLVLPLAPWDLVARAFSIAYLVVVPAGYFVVLHGATGQTLGKRLLGARVLTADGGPLGFPRALARQLAWVLSVPLGIGYLVAAARKDRRALHDLLAGTRVVRVG